jgi:hypothetical protein
MAWLDIAGTNGMYSVNEEGQVFSRHCGRMLKPGIASNGYPTVVVVPLGTRTLHSLVADAFLGPRPEGQEVRHKDGCRTNPKLDNLEFGTRTENIYDSIRHQQWFSERRLVALEATKKLTPEQRAFASENWPRLSLRAIGRHLGVMHGTVKRYLTETGEYDGLART